jgi:hypothetical protein
MQRIEVVDLIERDDGSATIVVELDENTKCRLLSAGLKVLLTEYIEDQD